MSQRGGIAPMPFSWADHIQPVTDQVLPRSHYALNSLRVYLVNYRVIVLVYLSDYLIDSSILSFDR